MAGAMTFLGAALKAGNKYIKSVQYVSITIAAGATSGTATISSVDTARTFLNHNGVTTAAASGATRDTIWPGVTLTNSTTITASRITASSDTVTINVGIVEGTSLLVDSVQYGTITTTSSSVNATVTSVITSQSAAIWNGCTTTSASGSGAAENSRYYGSFVDLTSSTTVNATDDTFGSNRVTYFCLVQFASGALQSLQRLSDDYTSANTTDTKTISSVTVGNVFVAWGCGTRNTNAATNVYHGILSSSTTFDFVRAQTGTAIRKPRCTIVEFVSAVVGVSAQGGAITLNNVTSATATLSPTMNTSKTILNMLGSTAPTGDQTSEWQKIELTNSSTVTATVNSTSASSNRKSGWRAIELT